MDLRKGKTPGAGVRASVVPNSSSKRGSDHGLRNKRSPSVPVTHISVATTDHDTSTNSTTLETTPNLIRKMESLDIQWSTGSRKQHRHRDLFADDLDSTSFLSLNSSSATSFDLLASKQTPTRSIVIDEFSDNHDDEHDIDDWTVSLRSTQSSAGESVFDRLYEQGKAKLRAERYQATNNSRRRLGRGSDISVGETTVSSHDSVFERLYRNEKSKKRLRRDIGMAPQLSVDADDGAASVQSTGSSWQRRVSYTPPMDVRSRRLRSSRSGIISPSRTMSSATTSSGVFDRLYRNASRSKSTSGSSSSQRVAQQIVTPSARMRRRSNMVQPKIYSDVLVSGTSIVTPRVGMSDSVSSPMTLSPRSRSILPDHDTAQPLSTRSWSKRDDCGLSLLSKEVSLVSERISENEMLLSQIEESRSPELDLLAREVSLVDDSFTIGTETPEASVFTESAASPLRNVAAYGKRELNEEAIRSIQRVWRLRQVRQSLDKVKRLESEPRESGAETSVVGTRAKFELCNQKLSPTRPDESILIQRIWRGYRECSQYRIHLTSIKRIQSVWRMHFQRRAFLATIDWVDSLSTADKNFGNASFSVASFDTIDDSVSAESRFAVTRIQSICRGYLGRRQSLFCVVSNSKTARAFLLMAEEEAAKTIQAEWKRYSCAKNFALARVGATSIQALHRGGQIRQKYQGMRTRCVSDSVNKIQRWWRAKMTVRFSAAVAIQAQWKGGSVRSKFHMMLATVSSIRAVSRAHTARHADSQCRENEAARTIQLEWKRCILIGQLDLARACAVSIQALHRGNQARRMYQDLQGHRSRDSVANIQRWWRVHLATRFNATTLIQSQWKGSSSRSKFYWTRAAAVCIQAIFRAYKVRRRLNQLHGCARTIQQSWRRFKSAEEARDNTLVSSAAKIQSLHRMHFCRSKFIAVMRGVVLTQACFRGYDYRLSSARVFVASSVIQAKVRGFLARSAYMRQVASLFLFQSLVRMRREQCRLRRAQQAAGRVQSNWRGHRLKLKAAIIIQKSWREFSARMMFQSYKTPAGLIEGAYITYRRREFIRLANERRLIAAILIQTRVRRTLCQQRFRSARAAASMIQAIYRMSDSRNHSLRSLTAVRTMQQAYRSFSRRSKFALRVACSISLQSQWRVFACREAFRRKRLAALLIQANVRAFCFRKTFLHRRFQTVLLQTLWRKHMITCRFSQQRAACIMLQCFVRGGVARSHFLTQRAACVTLQSSWRMQFNLLAYVYSRSSACIIQAAARSLLARAELAQYHSSSLVVQTSWRRYIAQSNFAKLRAAVVVVQSVCRRLSGLQSFSQSRIAACTVEAQWRMYESQSLFLKKQSAAVCVQTTWRVYVTMKQFWLARLSIARLQRSYRRTLFTRHLNELAIYIQAHTRMHLSRKRYLLSLAKMKSIQDWYRACASQRKFRLTRVSIIKVQALNRGSFVRRKYIRVRKATVALQATRRRYLVRCHVSRRDSTCIAIQAQYRCHVSRANFWRRKESCITLQSFWRRYLASALLSRSRSSCCVLQSAYRRYEARSRFCLLQRSAIVLQSAWRCRASRRRLQLTVASVTRLQRAWHASRHRAVFVFLRQQVIVIQSVLRMYRALVTTSKLRTEHFAIVKRDEAVVKIQATIRFAIDRKRVLRTRLHARRIAILFLASQVDRIAEKVRRVTGLLRLRSFGTLSPRAGKYALLQLRVYREHYAVSHLLDAALTGVGMRSMAGWCKTQLIAENAVCLIIQRAYRSHRDRSHATKPLRRSFAFTLVEQSNMIEEARAISSATPNPLQRRPRQRPLEQLSPTTGRCIATLDPQHDHTVAQHFCDQLHILPSNVDSFQHDAVTIERGIFVEQTPRLCAKTDFVHRGKSVYRSQNPEDTRITTPLYELHPAVDSIECEMGVRGTCDDTETSLHHTRGSKKHAQHSEIDGRTMSKNGNSTNAALLNRAYHIKRARALIQQSSPTRCKNHSHNRATSTSTEDAELTADSAHRQNELRMLPVKEASTCTLNESMNSDVKTHDKPARALITKVPYRSPQWAASTLKDGTTRVKVHHPDDAAARFIADAIARRENITSNTGCSQHKSATASFNSTKRAAHHSHKSIETAVAFSDSKITEGQKFADKPTSPATHSSLNPRDIAPSPAPRQPLEKVVPFLPFQLSPCCAPSDTHKLGRACTSPKNTEFQAAAPTPSLAHRTQSTKCVSVKVIRRINNQKLLVEYCQLLHSRRERAAMTLQMWFRTYVMQG